MEGAPVGRQSKSLTGRGYGPRTATSVQEQSRLTGHPDRSGQEVGHSDCSFHLPLVAGDNVLTDSRSRSLVDPMKTLILSNSWHLTPKAIVRLLQAYRRTTYVARTEDGIIRLRIGRRSLPLDRVMLRRGATSWAFITAYNPVSIPQSLEANKLAQGKLRRAIRRRGLTFWVGEGVGDDRRWPPEPSFLILDIEEERARAIGRKFGQLAVLVGRKRAPARLVQCLGNAE